MKWRRKSHEWHYWFAWFPVYCPDIEMTVWLETVWRKENVWEGWVVRYERAERAEGGES